MCASRRRALMGLAGWLAWPCAATAAPKVQAVVIEKMAFGPPPSGLRVGDTIEWVNKDIFQHTATARDKSFDVDLRPNRSGRTVLRGAGKVAVFCRYHPAMTLALRVQA